MTRVSLPVALPTLLAVLFTAALLAIMPAQPTMAGDSSTYLDFAPFRTAGYPLFLDLFGSAAPIAQILIFGAASATLGKAVAQCTGKAWAGALVVLGMFINPEVAPLHWTILTDSLSISLAAVFLACCLNRRWLAAAAVAGLAATMRPSAYPMIAVLLLLLIPQWRLMLYAALIWLGIVGVERAYSFSVHGDHLSSLTGRHLYAKGALISGPEFASVRRLLAEADGLPAQDALRQDYEVCIQWACSANIPMQGRGEIGLKRIAADPLAYLKLTWDEYRGLWVFASRTHPALAPQYDAFVRSHDMPFPDAIAKGGSLKPTTPSRTAIVARPLFIALGFLMALALAWALIRRDRELLIPTLFTQATLVFTALTAVGYGRYTMLVWPAIIVTLVMLMLTALALLPRQSQTRHP